MRKYVCTTLAVATGIILAVVLIHLFPSAHDPRPAWIQLQRDLLELSQATGLRPQTRLLKPEIFVAAANRLANDIQLLQPADRPSSNTFAHIRQVSGYADLCHECANSVFHPSRDQDVWWSRLQAIHRLLLDELPVATSALDAELASLPR